MKINKICFMLCLFAGVLSSCSTLQKQAVYCEKKEVWRSWFEDAEQQVQTQGGSYPVTVTKGDGRPILLLHEVNGQSPAALSLAHELARRGCKVYVPRFFGSFGTDQTGLLLVAPFRSRWGMCCHETGPIRGDVKEIAMWVKRQHPGQSLTVIGNCMTGAFPLELLAETGIDTAVVSQPALPLPSLTDNLGLPDQSITQTLVAMKKHPEKHLISFNYYADKSAPICKQDVLARKTMEAGVGSQHDLWIGMLPEANLEKRGMKWLESHPGWHRVPVEQRGFMASHTTITGAGEPDVTLFRKALYQSLHLPLEVKSGSSF